MLSRIVHGVPLVVAALLCLTLSFVNLSMARSAGELAEPGRPDFYLHLSVSSLRTGIGSAFGVMMLVCYAALFAANRLAERLRASEDRITALEAELRKLREPGDA
jgi:hypothetical protein